MSTSNSYSLGLLVLRVGFSAMLLVHGIQKIEILFSSEINFSDPIGLGPTITLLLVLFAEIICPILIIVGIKTRLATIPPIILMFVAIVIVHKGDPIMARELAILYLIAFITIGLLGGGRLALRR
jgi:putative oxidoreductase